MAGTIAGGKLAAKTNKQRDPNFYKKIGSKGGKKGTTGGFAYSKMHGLSTHITAGAKGGRISRRKPNVG